MEMLGEYNYFVAISVTSAAFFVVLMSCHLKNSNDLVIRLKTRFQHQQSVSNLLQQFRDSNQKGIDFDEHGKCDSVTNRIEE